VLLAGLQDRDDSVQAAAAEALVPLAPQLLQMQAEDVSCPPTPNAAALACMCFYTLEKAQVQKQAGSWCLPNS
jgi:hypothetical protein